MTLADVTEVLILTKASPPFAQPLPLAGPSSAIQANGYSIAVLQAVFEDLLPALTPRVELLAGNAEILSALQSGRCNATTNGQRLCIGAAAMSITRAREESEDRHCGSLWRSASRIVVG